MLKVATVKSHTNGDYEIFLNLKEKSLYSKSNEGTFLLDESEGYATLTNCTDIIRSIWHTEKKHFEEIQLSEITDNLIEQLEEIGRITVMNIENIQTCIDELNELGYDAYLDESTDYIRINRIEDCE